MSKAAEVSNTLAYSSLEGAAISCIRPTIQPMTRLSQHIIGERENQASTLQW
jgi:hypothetical protein